MPPPWPTPPTPPAPPTPPIARLPAMVQLVSVIVPGPASTKVKLMMPPPCPTPPAPPAPPAPPMAWLPMNEQFVTFAVLFTPEMKAPASATPPSPLASAAPPRAWFPVNVVLVMVRIESFTLLRPPPEAAAPGPVPTARLLVNVLLEMVAVPNALSKAPLPAKKKPADRLFVKLQLLTLIVAKIFARAPPKLSEAPPRAWLAVNVGVLGVREEANGVGTARQWHRRAE